MELSYLLKELRPKINEMNDFKSFVIRKNPKKDDDYLELPIKDVVLDEDGDEINIIIFDDTDEIEKPETLSFGQLMEKLEAFMPQGSSFHIFVSHQAVDLGEDYLARLDVPIVAHGVSEESCCFGLLEQESK